jgi:phosphoribosylanthranilate isomerase
MSWIKICGLTTPEAVDAALTARVDAIGFVFAPSARQLAVPVAAQLAAPARGRLRVIAVTRHPTQALVDEILATLAPDALQSDFEDLTQLSLPRLLERLPVVRAGGAWPEPLPARVLYEGAASGTGVACDWTGARVLAPRLELVLAGGLAPHTVAAAIQTVAPFGVDVSSGVEARPGVKSPRKILEFAVAAHAAFREREEEMT